MRKRGPGLRVQILLALAGVILVAYVPLFFAVAEIARATSLAYREDAARSLGRAVAAHVADMGTSSRASLERTIASHVGDGGAIAVAVFGPQGDVLASGGPAAEVAMLHAPPGATRPRSRTDARRAAWARVRRASTRCAARAAASSRSPTASVARTGGLPEARSLTRPAPSGVEP